MNQLAKPILKSAAVLATALFAAANFAHASPMSDDQSLRRGAIEDMTPRQKYQTAIREAGGGYKESLRGCAQTAGDDRQECTREAKATYDRDMAEAKLILRTRADAGMRMR